MKFLVISDLHGNTEILDKLAEEFQQNDIVLFGGDFAAFEHPETGEPTLNALCEKTDHLYSVIGNCDEPSFLEKIENKDVSVQNTLLFQNGLAFAGCGGGTKHTGVTPNERTEEDILSDFSIFKTLTEETMDWNNLILIMHNPPKDTKCDQVAPDVHVGSEKLRLFIEEKKPLAVITGHIHEGIGIDYIGSTIVINPGPLAEGNYAVLDIVKEHGRWNINKAELKKINK